MRIGVVFPQTEIGSNPETISRYATGVEASGFDHILAYDHVLGANADREGGWEGPYDHRDPFHEPFTLLSYLAGVTDRIEFATGILILPQRQTALVAKQAAEVDILSEGRFRLGIGLGWNPLEYVALDEAFEERGRRMDEQIPLLEKLWTENPTNFSGTFHEIPDAGINPLPVQQPIPLWMGGSATPALRRIARWGEGWIARPQRYPDEEVEDTIDRLEQAVTAEGRDFDDVGIHVLVPLHEGGPERWREQLESWARLDPDYLSVDTMDADYGFDTHLDVLRHFREQASEWGYDFERDG